MSKQVKQTSVGQMSVGYLSWPMPVGNLPWPNACLSYVLAKCLLVICLGQMPVGDLSWQNNVCS
jgi:hypothetical protein